MHPLLLQPPERWEAGTAGSTAPPAAHPPGEPVPCAQARCLQGFCGSSQCSGRLLSI